MEIKLTIVPEGAGSNKTYEFSNWKELLEFTTTKIEGEPEVKVEEPNDEFGSTGGGGEVQTAEIKTPTEEVGEEKKSEEVVPDEVTKEDTNKVE